uniref:polysaccharide deacetylase family protein n=1 Tax=Nocardioides sp. TaxID=35761 RepID=UPI00356638D8
GLNMIGWHRVDGERTDGLSTGVDDFQRHLDDLEDWGARILPLDEAVAALAAGTLPEKAVVLTFDDGYASVLETAWPLLRERSMPATFFVVSGILDRPMSFPWDAHEHDHGGRLRLATADELLDAAREGLDIGSHTVTHPWLPRLDAGELKRELVDSRVALTELLGRTITSLAYPTGGWNRSVRDAVDDAGYSIAITVDRGMNTRRTHPLSLKRSFVPEDPRDLRLVLDGAYTMLRPLDELRGRSGPPW